MVHSLTNPVDKSKKKMTERILNLTLEIIYLLTGEDFTLVKKTSTSSESVRSSCLPYVSVEWSKMETQSPILMTTNHSLPYAKNNKQKIIELTNKIIELLTGEVPIRYHDITVYFSMEEWEYLEQCKDQYKDVILDQQPIVSPVQFGIKNTTQRCPSPLYSQDSPEENHCLSLDHQSEELNNIKIEVIEDIFMEGNIQYKEEKMNVKVYQGDDCAKLSEGHPLLPYYKAERKDIIHHTSENSITPNMLSVLPSRNLSPDLTNHTLETSSDPSQIAKQTKGHKEDKIFQCCECGKQYKNAFNLYMHKRIHRDERPFSCSECGKSFTKKSVLIEHYRVHTGEKPYSCSECGKSFTRKSILVEHQRSHTGDKPFLCSECGRCFARKSHLERHLRTHTGEKPFSCLECEKGFIQKIHLIEHQRIHTENKPFTCPVCGKCFIQKSHLVKHQKTHGVQKPSQ